MLSGTLLGRSTRGGSTCSTHDAGAAKLMTDGRAQLTMRSTFAASLSRSDSYTNARGGDGVDARVEGDFPQSQHAPLN